MRNLKKGTVKSSGFRSDNEASFKISKSNGKEYIDAIKEGTGYVILTIKTTDNNTYTERLFISVYRKVEKSIGIALEKLTVYRGASENANVENEDAKGEIQKNKDFYVVAMCEDFYLIQTKDGSKFIDDYDTGFVRKKNIKIPISRIELNKTSLSLVEGQEFKLTAKVLPEYTTENINIVWSTSDKKIVVVYNDGAIYAKTKGQANIYAVCGNISNFCNVEVGENVSSVKFKSKKRVISPITRDYRYSFLNDSKSFGDKYVLNRKLRRKLAKKLFQLGYFDTVKVAEQRINRLLGRKWGGSCYGMSVTTALNKKKQINVREYTKSEGEGYKINKVKKPLDNKRTANIINYYFASQLGFNQDEKIYSINDEGALYNSEVRTALNDFVRKSKHRVVQNFSFYMTEEDGKIVGGHTILALDYDYKKSNRKWHVIKTYDCSVSKGDSYIMINKKTCKIRVKIWSDSYNVTSYYSNSDFERYNKIKIK